ncbi:hypothetical protein [Limnobacter sp.]|uniref:hypothetical protein n=1 Tax=Limnobacter sp. TaxID=2003368 RepID=UPI0037491F51
MITKNPRKVAILNRLKILQFVNRFGWLRTRDLACLVWLPSRRGDPGQPPDFLPASVTSSALRMAQRTIRSLLASGFLLQTKAPDGALVYSLSQRGADILRQTGVEAKSGKDLLRAHSIGYYRHRCISNEIGISAWLAGCKFTTENELVRGDCPYLNKAFGKVPDVLVRHFDHWFWIEVERSRKNQSDYLRLLHWLESINTKPQDLLTGFPSASVRVIFICRDAFEKRLRADLKKRGWSGSQIDTLISFKVSLYSFEVIPLS